MTQVDTILLKTRYHNNRTEKQAKAIVERLKVLGVDESKLSVITEAIPANEQEEKKLLIKIVARKD